MAIVSTVLPVILMSVGIRLIGSSHASMLGTVGPVATIFLGFVFLDEPITAIQLVGAALVVAGVLAISLAKAPSEAEGVGEGLFNARRGIATPRWIWG